MSDKKQDALSIADRLSGFLGQHRRILLVAGALLVIGIFATVVVFQVYESRMERAARAAELLAEDWTEWQRIADDDVSEREAVTTRIRDRASEILNDYPRSYGALRALQILTRLEWELEDYSAARDTALRIADSFPQSHLTGTALVNAAAAAEELGDRDDARTYLNRIVNGDGAPTAETPRALFNLGRLAEQEGSTAEALDYYNRLVDNHPDSNWTNLGRNRIIWLTSQGVGADT